MDGQIGPKHIPTQVGDVLILGTVQSFIIYAVGRIASDGQQDFHSQTKVKYLRDRASAVAEATKMIAPGRRIFLQNIDTGKWAEI